MPACDSKTSSVVYNLSRLHTTLVPGWGRWGRRCTIEFMDRRGRCFSQVPHSHTPKVPSQKDITSYLWTDDLLVIDILGDVDLVSIIWFIADDFVMESDRLQSEKTVSRLACSSPRHLTLWLTND